MWPGSREHRRQRLLRSPYSHVNCAQLRAFIASRSRDLGTGNYSIQSRGALAIFGKVIPHLRLSDPPDIVMRSDYASCQYPKKGGSHAELESAICIFTADPSANAHICSRGNFNRDDGGHDTPRYAGRRAGNRMVLQKERKHELCVRDPSAVSGGHQRTRRHLRPTQASLEG